MRRTELFPTQKASSGRRAYARQFLERAQFRKTHHMEHDDEGDGGIQQVPGRHDRPSLGGTISSARTPKRRGEHPSNCHISSKMVDTESKEKR